MTRFLSEKRRIEVMENDFNRLLQTSQAVEEKLVHVSASDDTLQAVQVQIRKLEASISETEEKYHRIEKKNQILDETNDGINRNFKALQVSEAAVKKANEEIIGIFSELAGLRESIGILAEESARAQDAAGKLAVLDEALPQLEKRIAEMQVAREWLARTETELMALDKDAQTQLRLIRSLLDREGKKAPAGGKGAPPVRDREIILKLRRQGWTVEEIANSLGYSIGEVELTLEFEKLDTK
jgi:septal ring factor EnvC (AmiA/AmiB activator)